MLRSRSAERVLTAVLLLLSGQRREYQCAVVVKESYPLEVSPVSMCTHQGLCRREENTNVLINYVTCVCVRVCMCAILPSAYLMHSCEVIAAGHDSDQGAKAPPHATTRGAIFSEKERARGKD